MKKKKNSMPIALGVLLLIMLQLIIFAVMVMINGFSAVTVFLQFLLLTASLGIIFGAISLKKENKSTKLAPVAALVVSGMLLSVFFVILFSHSFGG